ncbi:hypothetical protein GCM10010912_11990 [Paenibacillus albidus]|uniref:HTH tetR-type domain-containing protein n=1 Tax=Paenibacillus albidus TaxID=2041023 RepID=A0A917C2F5_9BACL|nr:TetR/AcrR family transcriptional regulator [Paenibacillus albidus]GGF68552.1 hypothetical protein GCM10010912_11990 [Paenibacillus albidus]
MDKGENTIQPDRDTKQVILNATVELIHQEGFKCATLRKIAAKADTNLALINYYYGSKDQLLSDAVRMLISTFDDVFEPLDNKDLAPIDRMKQFFVNYVNRLQQYPGLARQMVDQGRLIMGSKDEYARYWKVMKVQKMHSTLQEITNEHDEVKLTMILLQLHGAVVLPAIMMSCLPGEQEQSEPICSFMPIEEQIDHLFEHFFHQYNI